MNPYATWLDAFLESRGLQLPDGRPLYSYRCTAREFGSLARTLEAYRHRGTAIRAFVIYAAEWWQRHYNGGPLAWQPLLESVGWHGVHYPDLYMPVRVALHWWHVELVRLPTQISYLGTFACQGGLPLALVGDADSRVTQYLRAVLRHTAAYRQFVDDAIDLARDQQHRLRPPTLRRDWRLVKPQRSSRRLCSLLRDRRTFGATRRNPSARPGAAIQGRRIERAQLLYNNGNGRRHRRSLGRDHEQHAAEFSQLSAARRPGRPPWRRHVVRRHALPEFAARRTGVQRPVVGLYLKDERYPRGTRQRPLGAEACQFAVSRCIPRGPGRSATQGRLVFPRG